MIVLLALSSACNAQTANPDFTEKEKQFIAEHPVIHLGF